MKAKIEDIVKEHLPEGKIIRLEDTSNQHSKHGNFNKESHFEIEVDAGEIPIYQRIKLHKTLTSALSFLYAPNMVHSISINIK